MFDRYTENARRAIFFARFEASHTGSSEISTEHLLIGVLRASREGAFRLLGSEALVDRVASQIKRGFPPAQEKISTSVDLPLDTPCKQVLADAAEEAELLNDRHIGPEHLLLGVLRQQQTAASRILQTAGLKLENARRKLKAQRAEESGARAASAPSAAAQQASVGQADGCVEFVCEGVRVGISALGLVQLLPREGELLVIDDAQMGLRGFRVREVMHYYESNPPGVAGAPHRLTKVLINVVRAEPGSSRSWEAT